MNRRNALLGALALLLGACVTVEPLSPGESFRFDMSYRGNGGERTLALDATADFGSPIGAELVLDDATGSDDAIDNVRRIHIGGFRPQSGRQRGAPTSGHIEWRELANRSPVELVLEYKGHRDVYHLTLPPRSGVFVDPPQGEFTRIFVKS